MVRANEILTTAAGHLQDRAATYDRPEGERSMGATVAAFRAVAGITLTEEQGWLFMVLLKAVRTQQGGHRADNYEDGAAYFALAGETAAVERTSPAKPTRAEELQTDDGWTAWGGGECPVDKGVIIEYLLRNGVGDKPRAAGDVEWDHTPAYASSDIVAYRIVKGQA